MDLLTVVMHEMGHVLGLSDIYDESSADDLMDAWLDVGQRKTVDDVDAVFASLD